jgi:hypothetical protein
VVLDKKDRSGNRAPLLLLLLLLPFLLCHWMDYSKGHGLMLTPVPVM